VDGFVTRYFAALNINIAVECDDADVLRLVQANLNFLQGRHDAPRLHYTIRRQEECGGGFVVASNGHYPSQVFDAGGLLEWLDANLVVDLQKLRRDLYFVHAAVLEHRGLAVMLVAPSGVGKSTTAWALAHHGFGYLSDELAPINLESLQVQSYPRALCLKTEPPPVYALPNTVLRTSRGLHVPADDLPGGVSISPATVSAIFFLGRQGPTRRPSVRRITNGEAVARLYANTLNSLAHSAWGLDGTIRIVSAAPAFELEVSDLPATCGLVIGTVAELRQGSDRTPRGLAVV
jgi:hypothetical protein